MPAMLQPKAVAKIKYAVIGKPDAIQDKKSAALKKINNSLKYQDSRLIR